MALAEVVTINEGTEKWFEIKAGYNTFYIPDVGELPEEYTIEFDIMAVGIDQKTSSSVVFRVILNDTDQFKWGNNALRKYTFMSVSSGRYTR